MRLGHPSCNASWILSVRLVLMLSTSTSEEDGPTAGEAFSASALRACSQVGFVGGSGRMWSECVGHDRSPSPCGQGGDYAVAGWITLLTKGANRPVPKSQSC